jgi:hypothetical protein
MTNILIETDMKLGIVHVTPNARHSKLLKRHILVHAAKAIEPWQCCEIDDDFNASPSLRPGEFPAWYRYGYTGINGDKHVEEGNVFWILVEGEVEHKYWDGCTRRL